MKGTVVGRKRGILIIEGEDGAKYYGAGQNLRRGTEVGFEINSADDEVADKVISFGINPEFSFRDNIFSLLLGLLIGVIIAFLLVKPVHAETIDPKDKALLVQIVHAEAGNQDLLGRRLVVDVVLNRVEHSDFPNTISGVIYQPGQFQPVINGTINLTPDEMDALAVEMELKQRTNNRLLYFRTKRYASYGEPAYKVGDHYFS